MNLHLNLTESDEEGTQWITKLAFYIKWSFWCRRRRQNLGNDLREECFAEKTRSECTILTSCIALQLPLHCFLFFLFYPKWMLQHIQAICCLSKDTFQQMLWYGKLHERASLGCLLEWQRGPCKNTQASLRGRDFSSLLSLIPFGDTFSLETRTQFQFSALETFETKGRELKASKTYYHVLKQNPRALANSPSSSKVCAE